MQATEYIVGPNGGRDEPDGAAERPEEQGKQDEPDRPDLTRLTRRLHGPLGTIAAVLTALLALALFYTLYVAQSFLMPLVIAVMLNFLLSPAVRFFERMRLPSPVGAAIVLLALLGTLGFGLYKLSGPASDWMERAPERLRQAEYKLRGIRASLEKVEKAAAEIEKLTNGEDGARARQDNVQEVQVKRATLSQALMNQTREFLVGGTVMFFLLYFLLASSDLFLRKLVRVLPQLRHKRNAVSIIRHTEDDLSRYFLTVTLINAGLGGAVALALYLLGMPNPLLWGVLAGFLNFIPYLGGLVGVSVIAIVAITSFETLGAAVAPPLAYLALNTLEAYVVTPIVMGRRLMLNPVAVFLSIIFWGWIWGIAGALLAVPLLVSFKIICDNLELLSPIGEFLGR